MRAQRAVGTGLLLVSLVAAVWGGWAEWQHRAGEPTSIALVQVALSLVGLGWAAIGAVLTWLRPRNVLGWLMLVVGTTTQVALAEESLARLGVLGGDPAHPWDGRGAGLALTIVGGFLIFALLGLLPVLYPSGRLPGPRWRAPTVAVLTAAALMQVQWLLAALDDAWAWPFSAAPHSTQPVWLVWAPTAVYAAATLAVWTGCVARLVRARRPERQQLSWLLTAVVVILVTQSLGDSTAALWAQAAGLYLLPAAVAVGILRYRLLGIELVLRRGLVYAALTAAIVALHAVVALVTGARLTGGALPGVVAAAVVAVGLTPVRVRLQRGVDRLLYGHRSDPVRAVADLGDRVAAARERDLLDAVLEGVRTAVRAAGARILGSDGAVLAVAGSCATAPGPPRVPDPPDMPPDSLAVPLTVSGEPVGTLQLAPRAPSEQYSPPDERLVAAMAPQVAVVVRALDLAAALEAQRDAVVDARRAERERLRRDLHDGLGPSLTGVGLGLRALDDAVETGDAARAREIASVLETEVSAAVTEVRRILQDLRPAPVAEHGLAAALVRGLATPGSSLAVEVTVGDLPPMPPAVEDAVYRVALEAVTNVRRHAAATRATVDVRVAGARVVLRVADDGAGFPPDAAAGLGLASMRQRADALGGELSTTTTPGGTTVVLEVPVVGTTATTATGTTGSDPYVQAQPARSPVRVP
ncbi:hypothetical protein FE374_01045 [Georgenia yuyongxinii]|uniref:Oxygen sensor histidine kinase NreB n=1 Tax=Georgenia yuyongxinii TaxID=2589797 RepID=A0A5B8C1M7_9MICO|nr:ATP-binding protein [Georgenia yuyongxinii]QDC23401.1 hypothetical protein FE374_01045 [Georgenia yuyongxinii]